MIDIHVHLLPGIDNGPTTMDEALTLAQALVDEGVHTAIATPHYNDEYPPLPTPLLQEQVSTMQEELDQRNIPLQLLAGHEVLIRPGLLEDLQAGLVATLNGGRYLLLELWEHSWFSGTEQVIFELRASGIVPIIAHPERYLTFQQTPSRLAALLVEGALTQITAGSLLGIQGDTVRRTAEYLLKKRLVHFISTNAHKAGQHPLYALQALHRAEQLLNRSLVQQMVEEWPLAIVNNEARRFIL
jgi:protein-tyrosine phosphatase